MWSLLVNDNIKRDGNIGDNNKRTIFQIVKFHRARDVKSKKGETVPTEKDDEEEEVMILAPKRSNFNIVQWWCNDVTD